MLGLLSPASRHKVVRSAVRSRARNFARNVARSVASVSTFSVLFFGHYLLVLQGSNLSGVLSGVLREMLRGMLPGMLTVAARLSRHFFSTETLPGYACLVPAVEARQDAEGSKT